MHEEKIKELEEEIQKTPYNKATQKHIARLKARVAFLKGKSEKASSGKGSPTGIRKSGDATVLLIGPPSVGKSSLLNRLTNAESRVADYEFTTLEVIPGMLKYRGAKIQILDIPGIISEAAAGRGRGKEILSFARAADLILIMVDATKDPPRQAGKIKDELYTAGFRLDQDPPDIKLRKKSAGGLNIGLTGKSRLTQETVKDILGEFGINNADVVIRGKVGEDQLIDFLSGSRVYTKSLVLVNKTDLVKASKFTKGHIPVSALKGTGIEQLKQRLWGKLELIRIYMKKTGKEPDLSDPLITGKNSTVQDICIKIHRDMLRNFGHARIWGPSARFPGQKVGFTHRLKDRDIVELHQN